MYDLLTREQLHTLHELLYLIGQGIYDQMFDKDDRPAMPVLSDEWKRLYTQKINHSNIMRAVYDEMQRRDQLAGAGAGTIGLAELRISRGIDA